MGTVTEALERLRQFDEVTLNYATGGPLKDEVAGCVARIMGLMIGIDNNQDALTVAEVAEHLRWCSEFPGLCIKVNGRDNMIKFVDALAKMVERRAALEEINGYLESRGMPKIDPKSLTAQGLL